MTHYTYLIQHKTKDKRYIGVRSYNGKAIEDIEYWGSSKYLPNDVQTTHVKIILKEFSTRQKAVEHEILLHKLNNVVKDPSYYNRSAQTSTSYDTTGSTFKLTEEQRTKISIANKGKKRTLEQCEAQRKRQLGSTRSSEARLKHSQTIKANGSNVGIKNASFKPWYVSTSTVTHLFVNISKNEQSVLEGHYRKYYADLQKKFNRNKQPIFTKQYGIITLGDLPNQYKI